MFQPKELIHEQVVFISAESDGSGLKREKAPIIHLP